MDGRTCPERLHSEGHQEFLGEEDGSFLINIPELVLADVAERLLKLLQHPDSSEKEGVEGACT